MTDLPNPPPGDIRAELRLRPEQPRVTRLSRKVLITLGSVSAVAIMAALFWALDANRRANQSPTELYSTENRTPADGLAGLPKDYTGIPKLGPALPGDLGRPIVSAQDEGKPVVAPDIRTPRADPTEQRRLAEIEAARVAKVFTDSRGVQATVASAPAIGRVDPAAGLTLPAETPPLDPGAAQNMQDRKLAFVNAAVDRRTVTPDRVQEKASPYVVQAGTVIPAALITGIKSNLPGTITAQVTEQVYDTPTGKQLLIPQGARLIGQYDSQVAFGQSRVLLVWNRIIMPNGTSIVLERQPGADAEGYSGLEDDVDYHWGQLFKAALLSTLLSVGSEAGYSGNESDIARALRQGTSNSTSQIGRQIVGRQLNIQPTLTIRPGFPVRVIVNRDLILQPYGAAKEPS
ncbi:conjugal transfer protein TrbI [Afipia carboxidovorans OM5]|jgi:type IV secretion system protein VirB10|uniref:Conjugal transfer protein TrbI n=1 Tax=Afipia carboxidovorans (strain ATCC 49405 / DSM 1227 / KCTC 32145 / OM5) TaxID=504832 RepID=B6JHN8_AFIC5|nr:TrbI/VirB10 family protein [Afipia carboxidovorans]ACI93535.1 conjugal transfer protein TrbI [Afipia carboxidovorans OM5]AEI02764.1 conjugal transfer protein TrbI [Afipia carboxidovorans OM4]AEI06340.1 conjugal transfer protein TrbI [Afipia carboxidovorans OM5]